MKTTKVTNFKTFGKANFDALRTDLLAALKTVGDKYGLQFQTGSIGYSDTFFHTKITGTIVDESGDGMTPEAKEFKELAEFVGLKSDQLFKTFTAQGKEYKVIGLNSRASKMPVVLLDMAKATRVKASVEFVNKCFKINP